MVDKRLLVMLSIIAILSTSVVSLFFREKVVEPVEILRHDWNLPSEGESLLIPYEEGRFAYTFAIVARQPVAELELRFATLENQTLPRNISLVGESIAEKALSLPDVGPLLQTLESFSNATPMELKQADTTVQWRGHVYQAHILDYTESIEALAMPDTLRRLATIHAFLFNSDGGLARYYRGPPDFFWRRDTTLVDLTIQRNKNVTKYAQRASEATGTTPMDLAPPFGVLRFEDLKKDDRISITISFNPARVSGRKALMQVVAVHVDGVFHRLYISIMERTASG